MKNIFKCISVVCLAILTAGCNFLDMVPDNMPEMKDQYTNRDKALGALATCYSYLPSFNDLRYSMNFAGDEYCRIMTPGWDDVYNPEKLMRNLNSAANPVMNFWYGTGGAQSLYQGIRNCNEFLENIFSVPNMSESEKRDFAAQAKVLKAYFHFYLIRMYGPILIADKSTNVSSAPEEIYLERQPVDKCFEYVVDLIDEAMNDMPPTRVSTMAGQIDQCIARAIKADVLLTAASPLFNGNFEFYNNFKNKRGEHFFNMTEDPEKWKLALDAIEEAITYAENSANKSLYEYNDPVPLYDREDWGQSEIMQAAYNKRYCIVDAWNEELIWGSTIIRRAWNIDTEYVPEVATQCARVTNITEESAKFTGAGNWLSTPYHMLWTFYTRNGVPVEEDLTYPGNKPLEIVTIPQDDYHLGYMQQQSGEQTINLNLNREPRFYAWVCVDRCIWRTYDERCDMRLRYQETNGGAVADRKDNRYFTGIGIKKFVHPESQNGDYARIVNYPTPIYRLSDLYLMSAEARNEYSGPSQEVYDRLNAVRRKAGIPDVEEVWSDAKIVKTVNKHLDKDGLRSIIQQERLIELCYEGHRYFDILRWKRAAEFFNSPIQGFSVEEKTAENFYVLKTIQTRSFQTPRNYLCPIGMEEMLRNPNLVQTIGWE